MLYWEYNENLIKAQVMKIIVISPVIAAQVVMSQE